MAYVLETDNPFYPPRKLPIHHITKTLVFCGDRGQYVFKKPDELKADYKEACDRLQNVNLIKDEQKAKASKLLFCLKYLVMSDLIKDCPANKIATEIVKEYDI